MYGFGFVPAEFLPEGEDEYWLRNRAGRRKDWRALSSDEIGILVRHGNYCWDWSNLLVCDPFDPSLIRGSTFHGMVRLGALRHAVIKFHDFCVPAGIRNSTIVACDIGDDVSIQDCAYVSHYVIGDGCILSRVDELAATNHSKFGNGALMHGEDEDVRVKIEVMNEAGGRAILPFEEMIPADAFLWAGFRDDVALTDALVWITQERHGGWRGAYGTVGDRCVIKSCSIIKDVAIGSHAYIKGANKLKNLTILSSRQEPSQIGEGVEMVNGIVGYGSRVFYGAKAVRFVIGRNCELKYGARLIHSVLGDNSTVSCCEILNNLIFPMHEQHHNNSFLIASLVQGMSNMAAAATVGSNHNSRAPDGEIVAGRGFWPGLAVSLKHSSRFASFVLIAKGDYPAELDIRLPFSLVSNNVHRNSLEIMPAYYWVHNLYALERTSWKVRRRDRRKVKVQHVETDYLTPDIAEEIISAIAAIESMLAAESVASRDASPRGGGADSYENAVLCRGMERSRRRQVILRPIEGMTAYRQMLRWYAMRTLAVFLDERQGIGFCGMLSLLDVPADGSAEVERVTEWVNMGGQIAPAFRVDALRREIGEGKVKSWDEIHAVYREWLEEHPQDKARHAWATFLFVNGERLPSRDPDRAAAGDLFRRELAASVETCRMIARRIQDTRRKDFSNPFRKSTFRGDAEMERVLVGTADDPFVLHSQEEARRFEEMVARVLVRLGE